MPGARKRTRKRGSRARKKEIAIRRSSGSRERFDREKMAVTTARSGVPFLVARDVSKKVSRKIKREAGSRKTVTAGKVRRMIGDELALRNPRPRGAYDSRMTAGTGQKPALQKPKMGSAGGRQHSAYRADMDSVMHDKSKRRTAVR